MYSEVMKTVQCAHPHYHHNGFAGYGRPVAEFMHC